MLFYIEVKNIIVIFLKKNFGKKDLENAAKQKKFIVNFSKKIFLAKFKRHYGIFI